MIKARLQFRPLAGEDCLEPPAPRREGRSLLGGMGGPGIVLCPGGPEPPAVPPIPASAEVSAAALPRRAPSSSGRGSRRKTLRPSVLAHLHTVVSLFQRPVFMPATLSALARLMSYLLPLRPPLWLPTLRG